MHDNGPVVKVGRRWAARGERKEREGEGKELGFGPAPGFFPVLQFSFSRNLERIRKGENKIN